tara:strand:+ start:8753 stop:10123 length:1371 start_codon:yes stop_codon:yes gene_type:complete
VHAQETTDNLLNNPNFTTDTSGWTLSDTNQNKVKRDPATYSGSASKSVRFRYQGGNISQDVDISSASENHLIKEINMNFNSIGCGNTGGQWCTAGADDTVVSTITLSTESTTEVLSESIAVPYEDGWESYSFTKDVLGDFNTDNTSLNLTITGNDTGNSSYWWGPIIDDLSLTLTTEQYVEPEPEPEIEPQAQVEIEVEVEPEIETLIEGLDLSTELVNDIILDAPIEVAVVDPLPEIEEIAEVEEIIEIEVEVDIEPQIDTTVEIQVEPTVDIVEEIPEIEEIAEVEEIQEVEKVAEVEDELEEAVEDEPEELKDINMEEDLAEASNEEKPVSKKKEDKKEKTSSKKESVAKTETKSKKPVSSKKVESKKSADKKEEKKEVGVTLPQNYFTQLVELIIITESVSLTQENIYEQDVSFITGDITVDSLIGNSSSRWDDLVGKRYKYSPSGYRGSSR